MEEIGTLGLLMGISATAEAVDIEPSVVMHAIKATQFINGLRRLLVDSATLAGYGTTCRVFDITPKFLRNIINFDSRYKTYTQTDFVAVSVDAPDELNMEQWFKEEDLLITSISFDNRRKEGFRKVKTKADTLSYSQRWDLVHEAILWGQVNFEKVGNKYNVDLERIRYWALTSNKPNNANQTRTVASEVLTTALHELTSEF